MKPTFLLGVLTAGLLPIGLQNIPGNGTHSSTNGVSDSYSVDSHGHGTFTFTSPASGIVRTYDFRISPDGHTVYTIAQSDGGLSVTQRVSAGSRSFQ